jgi:hypothetical protein
LAASIDAGHVVALDHAVLAGDRDHAARVEAADVGAGQAHVGRADLHPAMSSASSTTRLMESTVASG